MHRVSLKVGDAELKLAPELGGGVAGLKLGGRDILRPAGGDSRSPLALAEFPMAPWVNRLAGGRFVWNGAEVRVSDAPGHDPQGLHGIAWRAQWTVAELSENVALLAMSWAGGDGFPFAFEISRRFELAEDRLRASMRLRNTGAREMPAAMGFHPYFPSPGAVLTAAVSRGWTTDADNLPAARAMAAEAALLAAGAQVQQLQLDTCFDGWDGLAQIAWPSHAIEMRATFAPFLQVYTPAGADFFCVEPQSAMPDGFNRPSATAGWTRLGAGEEIALDFEIRLILDAA